MMNWEQKRRLKPSVITGICEASPEEVRYDASRLGVLNQHIQSLIEEKVILSGSYCLWRNGKIFADAALGSLAREWQGRKLFTPDTFFEIQSVTKVFIAVAILKLAEDGMLYLGQPACEWIEEFNVKDYQDITIAHLLTHTSGLCGIIGALPEEERGWWDTIDDSRVRETWITAAVEVGLHAKPGERWIYSAVGYPVLGEIIQRASGMRLEEFIRQTIFEPCEMRESHWRTGAREEWIRRYNIANQTDLRMLHEFETDGFAAFTKSSYQWKEGIPEASAGIMSTGREMAHFGEMMLRNGYYKGHRVIGKTALSWLWSNLVAEGMTEQCWGHPDFPVLYGAGMPIATHKTDLQQLVSENVIYHEGSGTSVFLVDRQEDFIAVFQTSFPDENGWSHRAVKETASIIWSGIR